MLAMVSLLAGVFFMIWTMKALYTRQFGAFLARMGITFVVMVGGTFAANIVEKAIGGLEDSARPEQGSVQEQEDEWDGHVLSVLDR